MEENGNIHATSDQTYNDGVIMEYFDANDKATYGKSLFSRNTILEAVKRTYVNDEQDSIDSNGAYTDKSASMRRV